MVFALKTLLSVIILDNFLLGRRRSFTDINFTVDWLLYKSCGYTSMDTKKETEIYSYLCAFIIIVHSQQLYH